MTLDAPDAQITLTAEQLAAVALSTIRAAIGDVKYQYLSGPITGGQKYLNWHLATGRGIPETDYKGAREVAVVIPNIADVKTAAKAERDANRSTIEPGSFEAEFPQWGQKEFLYFWEKVIEEHAARVRFMDGWAYSAGCAFEYLCALRCGLETCDIRGRVFGPDAALALLDAALAEIWRQSDADNPQDAPLIKLHGAISGYRKEIAKLAV